jgi:hypothetical protein
MMKCSYVFSNLVMRLLATNFGSNELYSQLGPVGLYCLSVRLAVSLL